MHNQYSPLRVADSLINYTQHRALLVGLQFGDARPLNSGIVDPFLKCWAPAFWVFRIVVFYHFFNFNWLFQYNTENALVRRHICIAAPRNTGLSPARSLHPSRQGTSGLVLCTKSLIFARHCEITTQLRSIITSFLFLMWFLSLPINAASVTKSINRFAKVPVPQRIANAKIVQSDSHSASATTVREYCRSFVSCVAGQRSTQQMEVDLATS